MNGSQLTLITSTAWGSESGHTRINSVCVGDVTGDGKVEIVSAGRSGQIKSGEHLNSHEADQLVVWQFEGTGLVRQTTYEGQATSRSRFRALELADLDGLPGLELLAVGRHEPAASPGGRQKGAGGGHGTGRGGGGGSGKGGGRTATEQSPAVRPLASVFKVQEGALTRVFDADFGDALGEVRDVAMLNDTRGNLQIMTITASEVKPDRSARLDLWQPHGLALRPQDKQIVTLGDETRARQIVLWGPAGHLRLLTVGFVSRGEHILGQILDWGPLSTTMPITEK